MRGDEGGRGTQHDRPPNPPTYPAPLLLPQVSVLMGTISMIVFAVVLMVFRDQLGVLFTSDAEVIMLTSQVQGGGDAGGGEKGGGRGGYSASCGCYPPQPGVILISVMPRGLSGNSLRCFPPVPFFS